MTYKDREKLFREEKGREFYSFNDEEATPWSVYSARGREVLIDDGGHPYLKLSSSGSDIGGEFFCKKHLYEESSSLVPTFLTSPNGIYCYRGPQYAWRDVVEPSHFPELHPSDQIDLNAYGTTAIARVLPTNPVADLAVFLGELGREGIPNLPGVQTWRKRAIRVRDAGSEYLNYEYGWVPLVKDIRKFAKVVRNYERLLKQFEQRSGKGIRRQYYYPIVEDIYEEEIGLDTPKPQLIGPIYEDPFGTKIRTTTTSKEVWFSGSFTYLVSPVKRHKLDGGAYLQKANHLLGFRITPETLWNLTPWSWAADWIGNTGDVYHNISAFSNDGLVMRYGYVMERKLHRVVVSQTGVRYGNHPDLPCSFQQSFTTLCMTRKKATPFGFGLNPDLDFSNRQKAIVAALGLSRDRKSSRYR